MFYVSPASSRDLQTVQGGETEVCLQGFLQCRLSVHERKRGEKEMEMEMVEVGEDCPSSFLVGDASLPGGQHVVERISADAGPGEEKEANHRTAMK